MPALLRKFSRLGESIGRLLELPHEAVSAEPSIAVSGNRVVCIASCGVVTELTSERLSVDFSRYRLSIKGCGLNAVDYSDGGITVTGTLESIEFCPYDN